MQTIKIDGAAYDIGELKAAISKVGVKPVDARPIIKAGMLIGGAEDNYPTWVVPRDCKDGGWVIILENVGNMGLATRKEPLHAEGQPLPQGFKVFDPLDFGKSNAAITFTVNPAALDEAAVRAKYGFQVGDVVSIKGEGEFEEKHPGKGTVTVVFYDDKFPYKVSFGENFDCFRHDQLTLIEPSQGLPGQGLPQ